MLNDYQFADIDGQPYVLITLTRGKVAVIDAADLEIISPYRWSARKDRNTWHAMSSKSVQMHVLILNPPPGMVTDHRDGDGLNNRRSNLRPATLSQNHQNRIHIGNGRPKSSKYRGVFWFKASRKWGACIMLNQHNHHLGLFTNEEEAALAYDEAARKLFGEFARPNFVTGMVPSGRGWVPVSS